MGNARFLLVLFANYDAVEFFAVVATLILEIGVLAGLKGGAASA